MIKSIALSLPIYAMQSMSLPLNHSHKIDSLARKFWWGHSDLKKGLNLKAWNDLCLPKALGGLGFQKTAEMNITLLAKWSWQLLSGYQSLCCEVLRAKYLKKFDFANVSARNTDSWF